MSAKKMHSQFVEFLHQYEIMDIRMIPLKRQLQLKFEYMNQELLRNKTELDNRKKEVVCKIESIEEKYVEGDIEKELYLKYRSKYENQLTEIAVEEQKNEIPLSNSKKLIDFSVSMCQNLSKIWASGNLDNKMKLQKIVFPEGLTYDRPNEVYRTGRVNSVILQISHLAKVSDGNKKGNSSKNKKNSHIVPKVGIEPTHLTIHDFESCASTNSATSAFKIGAQI